jgi:isoleucyl-tRNA synthetase
MHKSKGNAIWFEDAAERMSADVMRWLFLRCNPANNLNFGYGPGDELKRGFLSTLANTYSFFVTYANIDGWTPSVRPEPLAGQAAGAAGAGSSSPAPRKERGPGAEVALTDLDRWAFSELNQLVATCPHALDNYDSMTACRHIEEFVDSLSNWYVRRSRRRFWKAESDADKNAAYETLWACLSTVNRLMAPMVPFLAEDMYQNLERSGVLDAREHPPHRLARRRRGARRHRTAQRRPGRPAHRLAGPRRPRQSQHQGAPTSGLGLRPSPPPVGGRGRAPTRRPGARRAERQAAARHRE